VNSGAPERLVRSSYSTSDTCLIFLVFCVVFLCFICLRYVSCLPNVVIISGLFILDCLFRFLYRLLCYLYIFTHTCVQYNFHIISVTWSLVLRVCFVDRCLSLCTYSVGHCVACSSMHGFWLSIWYLQTLQHTLNTTNPTVTRRVSYKGQELLTNCEHLNSPLFLVAHLFSFLCCVFVLYLSSLCALSTQCCHYQNRGWTQVLRNG
jgi:hypothetical protein